MTGEKGENLYRQHYGPGCRADPLVRGVTRVRRVPPPGPPSLRDPDVAKRRSIVKLCAGSSKRVAPSGRRCVSPPPQSGACWGKVQALKRLLQWVYEDQCPPPAAV
ncbi:hypothetical protein GN956_G21600 [Arapaima gigas]